MTKTYPLVIEEIEWNYYDWCLMSRGHHSPDGFFKKARRNMDYLGYSPNDWKPEDVKQGYWRFMLPEMACRSEGIYMPCEGPARGAFPVTWLELNTR